jgi:hypothetical protein
MKLSEQEKIALMHYLGLLLDADEPKAFLGSLRRVAERKAHSFIHAKIDENDCEQWYALAEALSKVEHEIHAKL